MGRAGTVDKFLDKRFTSQTEIREGMGELLEKLKETGHTCSLCTQQEINRSNYMRKEMGLESLFDALYFSAEIGYAKEDSRFYQTILDSSRISADQTLFIDDKQTYCDAAEEVGIKTFHFQGDVQKLDQRVFNKIS